MSSPPPAILCAGEPDSRHTCQLSCSAEPHVVPRPGGCRSSACRMAAACSTPRCRDRRAGRWCAARLASHCDAPTWPCRHRRLSRGRPPGFRDPCRRPEEEVSKVVACARRNAADAHAPQAGAGQWRRRDADRRRQGPDDGVDCCVKRAGSGHLGTPPRGRLVPVVRPPMVFRRAKLDRGWDGTGPSAWAWTVPRPRRGLADRGSTRRGCPVADGCGCTSIHLRAREGPMVRPSAGLGIRARTDSGDVTGLEEPVRRASLDAGARGLALRRTVPPRPPRQFSDRPPARRVFVAVPVEPVRSVE
jgi:hypothetical protein